jgi:D-aspartate ligase
VPVIACDHDPDALGLVSRYARPWRTRPPLDDPGGFVDDLMALGAELPAPGVLFPTHDEALTAVGEHEDRVATAFRRPWSPWSVVSRIVDKAHQHAVARSIGFPVPATLEPRDAGDLEQAARELRFPVILKPRRSPEFRARFRAQVLQAGDPEELRRAWDLAAEYEPQVSEVIPGGDDAIWTLGSYRDATMTPLASFTGHKLRQWPPGFGTGRSTEAVWDPGLAERGHRLLDALGFHGISQLEVKRDPRDGRDHLIEVNARPWLWIGLATAVGVNLPLAAYLDAIGTPRRWPPGHRSGVRWTLATRHLPASPVEIARGEWTAREFLASIRPPIHDAVLDLRDPRPGLHLLRAHGRRLTERLARR